MPSRDADGWRRECLYLDGVAAKQGRVPEMNYDTSTFIRYCQLQRTQAERDGQHDAVEYIDHIIHDMTRLL